MGRWAVPRRPASARVRPLLRPLTALALMASLAAPSTSAAQAAAPPAGAEDGHLLCASDECGEEEAEIVDDQLGEVMRVELLQRRLEHVEAGHGLKEQTSAQQRLSAETPQEPLSQQPAIDCDANPVFCSSKVNCATDPVTNAEKQEWGKRLATPDGHANLRTWCMVYPLYADSLDKCIVKDNKTEYARIMYEDQAKANLHAADAVYCFVAGHCNNTEITETSSLQDAEHICDKYYGERWKSVGWTDFMGVVARAQQTLKEGQEALKEGRESWTDLLSVARREAEISAMTACAMGTYQCDVFYCKNNYCNDETYRQQFGNMSWALA